MSDELLNLGTVTFKTDQEGKPKFSEWEHLQSVIMSQHNRLVQNYFKDVTEINFNGLTPRASLKYACWIKDKDTSVMTVLRLWAFYIITNYLKTVTEPYWGIPIEEQEIRKYKPQITLHFKEDSVDVEPGFNPVRGRISIRLMNETSQSITKNELINLGKKVKILFGASNGYQWKKGKDLASYKDIANGFDFQLLVRSKTDAKALITKVLEINDKTPNWKFLQYKENDEPTEAYPTIPPKHPILGKEVSEPRHRPIASVRFLYADARIWGKGKAIVIYDRTFLHPTALVTDHFETGVT